MSGTTQPRGTVYLAVPHFFIRRQEWSENFAYRDQKIFNPSRKPTERTVSRTLIYFRFWLFSEVAAHRIDARSARDSGPQSSDVRFRPADDRSCVGSRHPGGGRRRPLLTQRGCYDRSASHLFR